MIELRQELARASAMLDVKRFDEASALLSRVVAAEPESGRAWCLMARAHLGADRHAEAIEVANRAVALDPSDEWPHRLASNALVHLGNYSDALRAGHQAPGPAALRFRRHDVRQQRRRLVEPLDVEHRRSARQFLSQLDHG